MMVDSMRSLGKFDGDIKVFSTINAEMGGAKVIHTPKIADCFSIMASRWLLAKDMDVQGYDVVAMIDADVIAINPVQPMFDFANQSACISVAEEFPDGRVFHGNSPWSINGYDVPDGSTVYNAGTTFCYGPYLNEYANIMWQFMLMSRHGIPIPYPWIDQQVMNHLIRCGLVQFQMLPDNWVYIFRSGREVGLESKLVHMLPNGKERMMRAVYGLAAGKHINLNE